MFLCSCVLYEEFRTHNTEETIDVNDDLFFFFAAAAAAAIVARPINIAYACMRARRYMLSEYAWKEKKIQSVSERVAENFGLSPARIPNNNNNYNSL